jgi:hypothetical protein
MDVGFEAPQPKTRKPSVTRHANQHHSANIKFTSERKPLPAMTPFVRRSGERRDLAGVIGVCACDGNSSLQKLVVRSQEGLLDSILGCRTKYDSREMFQ